MRARSRGILHQFLPNELATKEVEIDVPLHMLNHLLEFRAPVARGLVPEEAED